VPTTKTEVVISEDNRRREMIIEEKGHHQHAWHAPNVRPTKMRAGARAANRKSTPFSDCTPIRLFIAIIRVLERVPDGISLPVAETTVLPLKERWRKGQVLFGPLAIRIRLVYLEYLSS
jgi:hypothetical protein